MIEEILNPHYDFQNEDNLAIIKSVQDYDAAFINQDLVQLEEFEKKALGGKNVYEIGINVKSPWGENKVLEAQIGDFSKAQDIVKKEITVKAGFMLSLQRHRGRQELWEVKRGILTVISDGTIHTIKTGDHISLPKGSVHCMINKNEEPVTIIEKQSGICREADNIRLIDFNNRPTVPLSNLNEAKSAILYAQIHTEIREKFGSETAPNPELLKIEFAQKLDELAQAA